MSEKQEVMETRSSRRMMSRRVYVVVILVAVLSFMAQALIPASWESSTAETIVILTPVTRWAINIVAFVSFCILIWTAFKCRRWAAARVALELGLLAYPACLIVAFILNPAPWTICSTVAGPDHQTYRFLDSSVLYVKRMTIGRLEGDSLLYQRYYYPGMTDGDSLYSWASVIRPAGAEEQLGQLYCSTSGLIVGVRSSNQCYMTFDPSSGEFLGREVVEEVSPFILLGPADALQQTDIERIQSRIREGEPDRPGYPKEHHLRQGLDHPNPEVQRVAKQLLEEIQADTDQPQPPVANDL